MYCFICHLLGSLSGGVKHLGPSGGGGGDGGGDGGDGGLSITGLGDDDASISKS